MQFRGVLLFGATFWFLNLLVTGLAHQYEEKYLTVPVDHFSFATNETFKLRYLINDNYTRGNPNAPILFYCGNEASIEFFAKTIGFIWEFAPQINALIVFAEHRYYGKSILLANDSTTDVEHFRYLTIEQALADFADVIIHLNGRAASNRPAIAIGGSFGGTLAALFRMKYPHLVAGALASSAPIKKFSNLTPCDEYSKIITKVFQNAHNKYCVPNVRKMWTDFRKVFYEEDGMDYFNEVFGFCEPWRDSDSLVPFLDRLSSLFWSVAMSNYPYEAEVKTLLPANPIKEFCKLLDVEYNGRELVKAVRLALDVLLNPKGDKPCFSFPKNVEEDYESKAWDFQTCTEGLVPFCSNPQASMFDFDDHSFEKLKQICEQTYGTRVEQSVNRINDHFGIRYLRTASKIIFSNGLLDPWSVASVLTAPNDQTLVINITDGAHHLDLRYSNEMDPPSVREARTLEKLYLKQYIREFKRRTLHYM